MLYLSKVVKNRSNLTFDCKIILRNVSHLRNRYVFENNDGKIRIHPDIH